MKEGRGAEAEETGDKRQKDRASGSSVLYPRHSRVLGPWSCT